MDGSLYQKSQNRSKKPREPLSTFKECAEKLKITESSLHGFMLHHPGFPAPAIHHGAGRQARTYTNWYRFSEVRRWWAEVQKKQADKEKGE